MQKIKTISVIMKEINSGAIFIVPYKKQMCISILKKNAPKIHTIF